MTERDRARRAVGTARTRHVLGVIATAVVLVSACALTLAPFLLSFLTSLTSTTQFGQQGPFGLPNPPVLDNYVDLFSRRVDFAEAFWTTVGLVAVVTVCQLFFSVLAAFAFARLRFPGRDVLFWVFLGTLMVPQVVTIVPLFLMLAQTGQRGTFLGLALPYLLGSPYAVFLLRESFRQIPQELVDAMRIDGGGTLRVLFSLIVPLSRPILVTLGLITVVTHWNNFMWPLMIGGNRVFVLTTATATLQEQYTNNTTLVMAATTLAMLPLIVVFVNFQRQIVRSISISGFR